MNGEKYQNQRIKIAKSTTIATKTAIGMPFALSECGITTEQEKRNERIKKNFRHSLSKR